MAAHPEDLIAFPAVVWQQLLYGFFAWGPERSSKRARNLLIMGGHYVVPFSRPHAAKAAALASDLKLEPIGLADFQIAATALVDNAELLTFNDKHFLRVPGLRLAKP